MNGLASASCARCVESSFINNKALLYVVRFFMDMFLSLLSCPVFLLSVPKPYVSTFSSFLYSSYHVSMSHNLPSLWYCPRSILSLLAVVPFRFLS